MKKVSEHLEQLHKSASRFHRSMAEAHQEASSHEEKGSAPHSFHKAAVAAHSSAADTHDAQLEETRKAIASADLEKGNRIVPDNVSGVHPGYRMIPRTGQREPIHGDKPKVDLALEAFVKVEDD